MVRNYTKKEPESRICYNCKDIFETARPQQRFCSEECRAGWHKAIRELGECPHCGRPLK